MKTAGFPREARLLSGIDFKRVFGARQVESNRYFRIHWAERQAHDDQQAPPSRADSPAASVIGPRLGLAVAKRVARRAVDRNRIRRAARETFRRRRTTLRPLDFIVLAKPPAVEADTRTLNLALEQLWSRFESS